MKPLLFATMLLALTTPRTAALRLSRTPAILATSSCTRHPAILATLRPWTGANNHGLVRMTQGSSAFTFSRDARALRQACRCRTLPGHLASWHYAVKRRNACQVMNVQEDNGQGLDAVASKGGREDGSEERFCWVRCVEDEPHFSLTIELGGKDATLNRMQEDPVQTTMERLQKLVKERFKDRSKGKLQSSANLDGKKKDKKPKGKGKRRLAEAEAAAAAAAAAAAVAATVAPAVQLGATEAAGNGEPEAGELDVNAKIWLADDENKELPTAILNKDALTDGRTLHIGELKFHIKRNTPAVKGMLVRQRAIVGFPLQPVYTCEFHTPSAETWRWWRVEESEAGQVRTQVGHSESYTPTQQDVGKFLAVEITPARRQGGDKTSQGSASGSEGLLMYGKSHYASLNDPVAPMPDLSVHTLRLSHHPRSMRSKEEGGAGEGGAWPLRLVSYNILADAYASTKFAREQLYGYCPASALSVDYRKQLAAWELMGYNSDVLCLQEVSQDVYDTYLEPVLRSKGYSGVYSNKISPHTKIGCATFWRHDRLSLARDAAPEVIDLTQGWIAHEDLHNVISAKSPAAQQLARALQRSTTMAQLLLLVPSAQGSGGGAARAPLCVVNTHLFGHPDATHVRLFQAATLMRHVERVAERYGVNQDNNLYNLAVVVCGDFNSQPQALSQSTCFTGTKVNTGTKVYTDAQGMQEGVRDLLTKGCVPFDHNDWVRAAKFRLIESRAEREANWFKQPAQGDEGGSGGKGGDVLGVEYRVGKDKEGQEGVDKELEEERLVFEAQEGAADIGIELRQTLRLEQGCSEVPYTYCIESCTQVVDYIYFSPGHLRPDPELSPFPVHRNEDVTANTAIPSKCYPSDHVPLVMDLLWK